MFHVYGDPVVMRYIPGGAYPSAADVERTLQRQAALQRERGFAWWAVVLRDGGRVIGDTGFGLLEETGDVEIGWTLACDAWGRGYGSEAAAACLAAGRARLDVPRIVAAVDAENEPSLRLARRIGMRESERRTLHGRPHVLFEG
jgi:RimJ/RimL family protein N-acetyltransferase